MLREPGNLDMSYSVKQVISAALTSALLVRSAPDSATAMPAGMLSAPAASLPPLFQDVRYRRPVRRSRSNGGAAMLGLFGAVLGGVIANQRYNDYSDYNYGPRNGYGYAPNYDHGPAYGGWRRDGGFHGQRVYPH